MYSIGWIYIIYPTIIKPIPYCCICRTCLHFLLSWQISLYINFHLIPWDKSLELLLPVQTQDRDSQILEVCLLPFTAYGSSLPYPTFVFHLPLLLMEKLFCTTWLQWPKWEEFCDAKEEEVVLHFQSQPFDWLPATSLKPLEE